MSQEAKMDHIKINIKEQKDEKKGGKTMKKIMITLFIAFVALVLGYGNADAVTGQCSNCHTMHDSQDGSDEGDAGAQTQLLKAGCVTCHTGPHGSGGDGRNDSYGAPVVLDTVDPSSTGGTATLAGGDFYWVDAGTDEKGHNVLDLPNISGQDATIASTTPPGWDEGATTGLTVDSKTIQVTGGAGWGGAQLTCAGTFGCHGTRDSAGFGGLSGAHHGNAGTSDQASTASTIGNSYRFLAGIKGLEHVNHNWSEAAATHNEYYGANDTSTERDDDATSTYTNSDTMSFFCAECHGDFHAKIDNDTSFGNPWVRHPSDIVLPNSGEFDDYNSDNGDNTAGNYNLTVPVARGAVPAASSATVTPGATTATGAIVMCLSCHRAHGSEYNDMLRFDYTAVTVGAGTTVGCFVCHTDKN
jgi:predicted CXXCH cytochrome family protein